MQEPFINSLPNELLTRIFEIASCNEDNQRPCYEARDPSQECFSQGRLMFVCQRWRIVGERLCYRQMDLSLQDKGPNTWIVVQRRPHVCAYVRHLRLYILLNEPVTQTTLDLLRRFSSVRKLDFTGPACFIDRPILEVFRTMPLTEVSLDHLPLPATIFELFDMPTLTRLSVKFLHSGKTSETSRLHSGEETGYLEEENDGSEGGSYDSDEESVSTSSPALDPENTNPPLNDDVSAVTRTSDERLPTNKHRTSKVTALHFSTPLADLDVAKQLFLWPARLEEVKLGMLNHWQYTAKGVQRLLLPQADSLRKIEIGRVSDGEDNIPDFSNFYRLEELTLSSSHIFWVSPHRVYKKLSTPSLKRLEISFSSDQIHNETLNDFGDNEMLWLDDFIEIVKDAPGTPNLKNIYVRFRPRPTIPARADVDEWPWDMFEELEELCEGYGIKFEYDQPEFTKREFSERYQSPSPDEDTSNDERSN